MQTARKALVACALLWFLGGHFALGMPGSIAWAEGERSVYETYQAPTPSTRPPSAPNQQDRGQPAPSEAAAGEGGGLSAILVRLVAALALILALIVGAGRWLSRRNPFVRPGMPVRALGGCAVGQNKSVQVVQIGDGLYVLGIGDDVQLLRYIPPGDEAERLRALFDAAGTGSDRRGWLGRIRGITFPMASEARTEGSSFSELLATRLQALREARAHLPVEAERKPDADGRERPE